MEQIEQKAIDAAAHKGLLARGNESVVGKAIFKKLHTIKHKSRFDHVQIDTYTHLYAKDEGDGTIKNAKNFEVRIYIEDLQELHTALQQILFEKLNTQKEKDS